MSMLMFINGIALGLIISFIYAVTKGYENCSMCRLMMTKNHRKYFSIDENDEPHMYCEHCAEKREKERCEVLVNSQTMK